jgi:glutathione S-transferase
MLEVYLDPATINSRKVLAGLELLGTPYELKHVNFFTGAHKQPDYLALNPNGTLPAAKDGDYTLWESDAILQYAADLTGSDQHYPKDLKKRADINRWMLWEAAHWYPSCYTFFVENAVKPLMKAPTDAELAPARRRP